MNATTLEKEIIDYLSILSSKEKEKVLSVIKTIALAHNDDDNIWEDKAFEEEMDSRAASFENGTAKTFTFDEMKKTTIEAYQTKKAKK